MLRVKTSSQRKGDASSFVHGLRLRSTSHLNGKIGDIRALSKDDSICEVHFEEEGLEPTKVKLENVRILFDLPEKKKTAQAIQHIWRSVKQ